MSVSRLPIRRRVFVDSSAYYATADKRSPQYDRSVEITRQFAVQGRHVFTTNFVVAEAHALLLNRLGRDIAVRVLRKVEDGSTTIVRVSEADELRAREIIFTQTGKDYTLTDATSFAVMERLRIGEAFTFDRHFAQFGFAVLGLDED